jgi:hypothetical protein
MNANQPSGSPQEESTTLHLGKFAPGSEPPPAMPPTEEGQTMFFRRVATEIAQQSGAPVVAPKAGNALGAKDLLGAVAYCYAKGVYSSSEIEDQMLRDAKLRAATQDEIPDANAIRRFRRLNREAIHQTLEKWYRKLRKARPTTEVMPGAEPPVPPPVIAATPAVPSDGNTSFIVKREASERLDKAAFIDNMEKD